MFIEKHKSIRILMYALIIIAFIVTTPQVSANSPLPTDTITIHLGEEYPQEIAFVDLLIPLEEDSPEYVVYNEKAGEKYAISSDSQIVNYKEEGFLSYSFHYKDASLGMEIEKEQYSSTYYEAEFTEGLGNLEDHIEDVKVVFLDEAGNILNITEKIKISGRMFYYFAGNIYIDPNTLEVTNDGSTFSLFSVIFVSIWISIRMAFSVSLEVLIAYLFKIPQVHKIAVLNIITQVLLTIFMIGTSLPYVWALIIGEIAVYLIEGIVLIKMYKTINSRKLLVFNVIANTATLGLGLLFNTLGIFRY